MISGHLTLETIAEWRQKRLAPGKRVDVVRHLGECESCRELAGSPDGRARLEDAFEAGNDDGHPGYDDLETLADGEADPVTHDLLLRHLERCDVCAGEYRDLRAFRDSMGEKGRGRRRIRWALPAAAVLAGAAVVLTIFVARAPRRGPEARAAVAATPTLVISVRDAGTTIGLDAAGVFEGLAGVPAKDRDLLRRVMQSQSLPSSPEALKLKRTREVTLGGSATSRPVFHSLEPAGTVIQGQNPEFRWAAPPGAARFVVAIYTMNFDPVMRSPELTANEWTADRQLARGQTYVWTVSGIVGGKRVTAPRAPEPEALFRVATDDERREFEAAKAAAPGSALLEAAVAARLGMVDTARQALARLAAANPGSPLVAALAKRSIPAPISPPAANLK